MRLTAFVGFFLLLGALVGTPGALGGDESAAKCSKKLQGCLVRVAMTNESGVKLKAALPGRVTSDLPGIDCPTDCREVWGGGTFVTLTVTTLPGWEFDQWSGVPESCPGADPCRVKVETASLVLAEFRRLPPTIDLDQEEGAEDAGEDVAPIRRSAGAASSLLAVNISGGAGTGTVERVGRASPKIRCGKTGLACYGEFRPGSTATLKATPAGGSVFARWSGACTGRSATCRLALDGDRTVTAHFLARRESNVAASLSTAATRVEWKESAGSGIVIVRGFLKTAASVDLTLRDLSGKSVAKLAFKGPRGRFGRALPLPAPSKRGISRVFPGAYFLTLTGSVGKARLPLQVATVVVPAPVEGVVGEVVVSGSKSGAALKRIPTTATEAWVTFRFATPPQSGAVEVRWYWPDGTLLHSAEKPSAAEIATSIHMLSGLLPGIWVVEVRAGDRVAKRAQVVVR